MPFGNYLRKPHSEETKKKIGLANSIALLGNKLSEETKRKISLANIGKKHPPRSAEWLRKQRLAKIGKKHLPHTEATKQKIRQAHLKSGNRPPVNKGENCHFWKGGITPINEAIRKSTEYKLWRQSVFKRDNFTCVWCGRLRVKIVADHIKPFSLFPELRFAIDNGRTLCQECHQTTDTYGAKIKKWNTKI